MNLPFVALSALSPILGLAVNCVVHVVLARANGPSYPYRSIVRAGFTGLVVVIAVSSSLPAPASETQADAAASILLSVVTYAALAFGYFSFVNLCLTSLRIRILQELRNAGGSLPAVTLQSLYGNDDLVVVRLQRLVTGGHLVQRNNVLYSAHSPFLVIARLFDFLRWFVLGPRDNSSRTRISL